MAEAVMNGTAAPRMKSPGTTPIGRPGHPALRAGLL